jgi:hypothetical protein
MEQVAISFLIKEDLQGPTGFCAEGNTGKGYSTVCEEFGNKAQPSWFNRASETK